MEEIWKDIPRFEGIYQASNLGNIRTCENKTTYTAKHGIRHWKQRTLKFKPSTTNNKKLKQGMGYRVDLWKNGKNKSYLVARLIATTFLDDLIKTKMTVNHKDGNRLNNNINNLEWLSLADNIRHGFENNFCKQCNTRLKNTVTQKILIFSSRSKASEFLKRSPNYISLCISKNRKITDKNNIIWKIV